MYHSIAFVHDSFYSLNQVALTYKLEVSTSRWKKTYENHVIEAPDGRDQASHVAMPIIMAGSLRLPMNYPFFRLHLDLWENCNLIYITLTYGYFSNCQIVDGHLFQVTKKVFRMKSKIFAVLESFIYYIICGRCGSMQGQLKKRKGWGEFKSDQKPEVLLV